MERPNPKPATSAQPAPKLRIAVVTDPYNPSIFLGAADCTFEVIHYESALHLPEEFNPAMLIHPAGVGPSFFGVVRHPALDRRRD